MRRSAAVGNDMNVYPTCLDISKKYEQQADKMNIDPASIITQKRSRKKRILSYVFDMR